MNSPHIAILMGGWSAEREVSLNSGKACAEALASKGYRVTAIDVQPDIAEVLSNLKPDIAFNALHGRFGEDGCIQGVLEILKIPYTHSGLLASSIAMDKPMAKKLFASVSLRCPKGKTVNSRELASGDPLSRPFVIKPANEGSSVGVHLVMEEDNRPVSLIAESAVDDYWLVEEYIPGRELTVAVLNDRSLAVTELRPHHGFYDYANKYTGGKTDHIIPADIPEAVYEEAMRMSLEAHRVLGCRGLSRADLRYDDRRPGTEGLYLLEVNTQPGMTSLSLLPEQAAYAGIDFASLCDMLVRQARLGR